MLRKLRVARVRTEVRESPADAGDSIVWQLAAGGCAVRGSCETDALEVGPYASVGPSVLPLGEGAGRGEAGD